MKKIITISAIALSLLIGQSSFGQREVINDTLTMSPGYSTDVFYSLKDGTVATAVRDSWDLAFYTQRFSAGILVNDGSARMLYTYPKGDTTAWASMDTTGLSAWSPMYNSEEIWEEGAFNRNALGHPDYGWGIYNMVNHHVYGDSLYLLSIPDPLDPTKQVWKKIWIREKQSVENIYLFTFADLDGSNERNVELDVKPYESKRFVYYSLLNNEVIDREPDAEAWDLLFTKYIDLVPDNEGNLSPYIVTGATSNVDIGTNRFYPVASDFNDWSAVPFDSTKNMIGWDWKEFDLGSFSWVVLDSNYYFVQSYGGDVYKIWFTLWEGTMTGKFALAKEMVSLSSIEESEWQTAELMVYPNPATTTFTVRIDEPLSGSVLVSIADHSGRMIYNREHAAGDLQAGIAFGNLDLVNGMYIIRISGDGFQTTQKLMVR